MSSCEYFPPLTLCITWLKRKTMLNLQIFPQPLRDCYGIKMHKQENCQNFRCTNIALSNTTVRTPSTVRVIYCNIHISISKSIVQCLHWKRWKNLQQSRPFPDSIQNTKKCEYYISTDLRKIRTTCVWNTLKSFGLNLEKSEAAEMASHCRTTFHRVGRRHKGTRSEL